jgi:flagellar assembly protein FliH
MSSKIVRGDQASFQKHLWQHASSAEQAASRPHPAESEPSGPEAERIRDLLLREFQSRIERERAQAFDSGREAGRNSAQQELQAPLERVARSLDELASCRARYRKETEREVVQLALEIARRILRRELTIDPEAVLGLVRAGLESVSLREVLEVRLHPSHAETVRLCLNKLGAPAGLAVIADPHLEPGAVLVETRRGGFDASADAQLEEIQRGFADLLEQSDAH